MGLFQKRSSGIGTAILCGVGGAVVGAGLVAALTPMSGSQLRKLVLELLNAKGDATAGNDADERQLDRMSGEGGVSHEVKPPLQGKPFESHS